MFIVNVYWSVRLWDAENLNPARMESPKLLILFHQQMVFARISYFTQTGWKNSGLSPCDPSRPCLQARAFRLGHRELGSGRTRPDVSNIPALCNVLGISIAEFFSNSLNAEEDERKLLFRYRQLNKPHQMVLLNMAEQLLNAEEQAISSECPELEELLLADDQVAAGANYYDFSACCKPCYVHSSPVVRRGRLCF